jgi:hypothetical protein
MMGRKKKWKPITHAECVRLAKMWTEKSGQAMTPEFFHARIVPTLDVLRAKFVAEGMDFDSYETLLIFAQEVVCPHIEKDLRSPRWN